MKGKSKCKILKDIRKQIAKENDIEFITSECKYQGDCLGTCPKCEAEVRYLEEELKKRKSAGKKIAVAGIAAAFTLTATSCNDFVSNIIGGPLQGDIPMPETSHETVDGEMPSVKEEISETATMGDVAPEESDYWQETPGEAMPEESEVSEEIEEMGELPAEEASQEVSEVEHTMGDPAPGYYD